MNLLEQLPSIIYFLKREDVSEDKPVESIKGIGKGKLKGIKSYGKYGKGYDYVFEIEELDNNSALSNTHSVYIGDCFETYVEAQDAYHRWIESQIKSLKSEIDRFTVELNSVDFDVFEEYNEHLKRVATQLINWDDIPF